MCGISGLFTAAGRDHAPKLVERVLDDQHDRGPDYRAQTTLEAGGGTVTLGHNRLSIIDLDPRSHQPIADPSGRWWLTFNGEIYNYLELRRELEGEGVAFRTQSDSEVLLAALIQWGDAALEKFNGMFAFGFLDKAEGRLLLARDRFAVKPLFYLERAGELVFASQARVLARHYGLKPDLGYVARGLRGLVYEDDGESAPYQGLKALPGGCKLAVHADGGALRAQPARWYDFAQKVRGRQESLANRALSDLAEELDAQVEQALALRLRADVPVGVSLSGGLDSCSVAARAARRQPGVYGYCFGDPDDPASEGGLAQQLSESAGVSPRFIWSQVIDDPVPSFWRTLRMQDAPFPTVSIIAQNEVFRVARAEGIRVMLGGQGGDEGFMGYNKFRLFQIRRLIQQRRYAAALAMGWSLGQNLSAWTSRLQSYWRRRHRYLSNEGPATALNLPDVTLPRAGMAPDETLWQRQVRDVTQISLPTLLRYEDRNSAGNSIESRLPFVDVNVMEFGAGLPIEAKLNHGFGKWLLRAANADLVPDAIRVNRSKRGFDVQQPRWIAAGLGAEIRRTLHHRHNVVREWLPADADVDALFSDARLGQQPQAFAEAVSLIWLSETAA